VTEGGARRARSVWSGILTVFRTQWELLGNVGRVATLFLVLSLVLALLLGVGIPALVERRLLEAHLETLSAVVEEFAAQGLIEAVNGEIPDMAALDEAVRGRLIGADVVRVKVWDINGTIIYSDLAEIVGTTYSPSPGLAGAFDGVPQSGHAGLEGDESVGERDLGHLWEFYVPVASAGEVAVVFEVYETARSLHAALASIRRWVWFAVGSGLAVLLVFNVNLVASNTRALTRRRNQAERLFADLAQAQEEERTRIIGALHDDIGQPLYRVLYGIQGSQSQLEPASPVAVELEKAAELVRWIDGTLRSELGMLQLGAIDPSQDLDGLLTRLASDVRRESSIDVTLQVGEYGPISEAARTALFRAAREAVTNARKHGDAQAVEITVARDRHRVVLEVADNGAGFDGEIGIGLATTRSRLEAIGGGLSVTKGRGGGTLFRAWIPESNAVAT
jgi:signal transduction histidine kinase